MSAWSLDSSLSMEQALWPNSSTLSMSTEAVDNASRPLSLVDLHVPPHHSGQRGAATERKICGQADGWSNSTRQSLQTPWCVTESLSSLSLDPLPPLMASRSHGDREAHVELIVSNLDQKYSMDQLKHILIEMFTYYIVIPKDKPNAVTSSFPSMSRTYTHDGHAHDLNFFNYSQVARIDDIKVSLHGDGSVTAVVRVCSLQDAQLAIAKLQRAKLGAKRIAINNNTMRSDVSGHHGYVAHHVVSLLLEAPFGKRVPLIVFREMYERRYNASISVSELHRIPDIIISDNGRMIQLKTYGRNNPNFNRDPRDGNASLDVSTITRRRAMADHQANNFQSSPHRQKYCIIHYKPSDCGNKLGWAERQECSTLPMVNIGLQELKPRLLQLIKEHGGSIPLLSLVHCYDHCFPEGKLVIDLEPGVPLEHLITCVKGVVIKSFDNITKHVVIIDPVEERMKTTSNSLANVSSTPSIYNVHNKENCGSMNGSLSGSAASLTSLFSTASAPPSTSVLSSASVPPLANQLSVFSRELVELLKSTKGARLAFHKFIPSYHHFFGRQCRVADYGYTRLRDLLASLPHVVQLLGEGSRIMVTLSHRAQMKRFGSDVIKMLKMQMGMKSMIVNQLPIIYEQCFGKPFDVTDYGMCELEDLVLELSESSSVLLLTSSVNEEKNLYDDGTMLSLPKREQTLDEVCKTQQFKDECVELLKLAPEFRMNFNKFIPNYHHHFGRQCRVADYGFSKLIELFEAINSTVEISEDAEGERVIQLSNDQCLRILGQQICELIGERQNKDLRLSELGEVYSEQYGFQLRPENFGQHSLQGVIGKLSSSLRLEPASDGSGDKVLKMIDKSFVSILRDRVKSMLVEAGSMKLKAFIEEYQARFSERFDYDVLQPDLEGLVQIRQEKYSLRDDNNNSNSNDNNNNVKDGEVRFDRNGTHENDGDHFKDMEIRLLPLELCAARIHVLIGESNVDKLSLCDIESMYPSRFGEPLSPGQFGFSNVASLIQIGLHNRFSLRGRANNKFVYKQHKKGCDFESDRRLQVQPNVQRFAEWSRQSQKARTTTSTQKFQTRLRSTFRQDQNAYCNESHHDYRFEESDLTNRDNQPYQHPIVRFNRASGVHNTASKSSYGQFCSYNVVGSPAYKNEEM